MRSADEWRGQASVSASTAEEDWGAEKPSSVQVPAPVISFTCAAPPSTNALYANVPGKGRVRTKRYRDWAKTAGWEVKLQARNEQLKGKFQLSIWLPNGIDLDNVKAIADLIGPGRHGLGITEDDRNMVSLHVQRGSQSNCRVEIASANGAT
jgi:Holliday junction resolvase RusA-like endonuclease